ncbi:MAG: protein translocase subunit SecD [Gemmataceae bacterium]
MDHSTFFYLWIGFAVLLAAAVVYGAVRTVKSLYWKIVVCLTPVLLSGIIVGQATARYYSGEGGFKLGVDLVGGTILVYEIDPDRKPENFSQDQLAAALKRRIDPADLYNVTIRPVGESRVEIILPTGGAFQAAKAEEAWKQVLAAVQEHFKDRLGGEELDVGRGQPEALAKLTTEKIEANDWKKLVAELREKYPKAKENKEIDKILPGEVHRLSAEVEKNINDGKPTDDEKKAVDDYIANNYKPTKIDEVGEFIRTVYGAGKQRKDVTGEEVENIKQKIKQVGSLEFRILANENDDKPVIDEIKKWYGDPVTKDKLARAAKKGQAPAVPPPPEGEKAWPNSMPPDREVGPLSYTWVELGKAERIKEGVNNDKEREGGSEWLRAAAAREKGEIITIGGGAVMYSRKCENQNIGEADRSAKKYEYFLLTRDPEVVEGESQAVTGQDLIYAHGDTTANLELAVAFTLNSQGSRRFADLTTKNKPDSKAAGGFERRLAIVLDGEIMSAPNLHEPITGGRGQISGRFTKKEIDNLVGILNSGALPATLKPLPVSENTVGPTLGSDTIRSGVQAIGLAFLAVLVFMCFYYRFAGIVASTALLANLLMTIAFMVFVNATFTLPGLAGLVLTLGMAVDANVLIYERVREERDRGANILMALRNGYDRALPTIIDTHLSSIFTAVVLYIVGNDQLKGFGVSLTAGLLISLFTSLFMTRTLFDLWTKLNLLTKLSMVRFLTRPTIDFMRIRYYWFAATIALTVFGITVFMIRGPQGLNIDFVGGTAYGGQLKEPLTIKDLRDKLGYENNRQQTLLAVQTVKQTDDEGRNFEISYADGQKQQVALANKAIGADATQREQNVKARASVLPDWSVEQIFVSTESNAGAASRFFTIRTTEKEPDLVQVTINRLLRENGQTLLKETKLEPPVVEGRYVKLVFSDFASPGFVKTLLDREFKAEGIKTAAFNVTGDDRPKEGRHKKMTADLTDASLSELFEPVKKADGAVEKGKDGIEVVKPSAKLQRILDQTVRAFETRPLPERLENFDAQLAADTQRAAMWAIILSWTAILLYLWLRFGTWTFGAAAVLCLIHDLFFTLGIIAFCHWIVQWMPGVASFLKIDDFKIDLPAVAALLTLVGYSVNDTIVVFDRIREVRGKNPLLTPQMINDSVNQTLSRTLLAATTVFLVVVVLYWFGGEGVHLFAFVMVVGVVVGTYSSIYIASPLLLIFGEGAPTKKLGSAPRPIPEGATTV